MFNLTLSIVLLASIPLVYFLIIRPRLKAKLTETYVHLDSFWARLWARTYAFRSTLIGALAAIAAALPDILANFAGIDFSFLPQPWGLYVGTFTGIVIPLMKAFETKPNGQQA